MVQDNWLKANTTYDGIIQHALLSWYGREVTDGNLIFSRRSCVSVCARLRLRSPQVSLSYGLPIPRSRLVEMVLSGCWSSRQALYSTLPVSFQRERRRHNVHPVSCNVRVEFAGTWQKEGNTGSVPIKKIGVQCEYRALNVSPSRPVPGRVIRNEGSLCS